MKERSLCMVEEAYSLRIVDTINEVGRQQWDALTEDNIYGTYGWLRSVEDGYRTKLSTKYFLVYDSQRLVGATVCYLSQHTGSEMDMDDEVFGRLRPYMSKLGISFLPVLICGPRGGMGVHFIVDKKVGEVETRTIMNKLLDGVEKEAIRNNTSLSFPYTMDSEVELVSLLRERKYNKAINFPVNYIDIEWSTFEEYVDYLKSISRRMKKVVKREINKNRNEGVIITEIEDLDKYEDRIFELINQNYFRYRGVSSPFSNKFFGILKQNLGENLVIHGAFKQKELIGAGIVLRKNRIAYCPMGGIDHEAAGNDFTYFNLAYYRPMMDAISDKMSRVYYGTTMYELKARRGCKLTYTYIYYKSFNKISNLAVKPWFMLLSMWYKYKVPRKAKQKYAAQRYFAI